MSSTGEGAVTAEADMTSLEFLGKERDFEKHREDNWKFWEIWEENEREASDEAMTDTEVVAIVDF